MPGCPKSRTRGPSSVLKFHLKRANFQGRKSNPCHLEVEGFLIWSVNGLQIFLASEQVAEEEKAGQGVETGKSSKSESAYQFLILRRNSKFEVQHSFERLKFLFFSPVEPPKLSDKQFSHRQYG